MSFDPISAIADLAGKVIDRVFPDPAQAAQAKLNLLQMQQTGELAQLTADTDLAKGQLAIDDDEAKSTNWFVSGWRPAIGWVCAAAFAWIYVLCPMLTWGLLAWGLHLPTFPTLDNSTLMTLTLGMLGLTGSHVYENIKTSSQSTTK